MKLHQSQNQGNNLFTGYGDGHVLINRERHDGNLIVSPDRVAPGPPRTLPGSQRSTLPLPSTLSPSWCCSARVPRCVFHIRN